MPACSTKMASGSSTSVASAIVCRAVSRTSPSSRDGTGIHALRLAILRDVASLPAASAGATVRMRVGIDAARQSLAAAAAIAAAARTGAICDEAIVAADLGRAIAALGEVTGAELGNDLIDRIFARHCIGK